MRLQFENRNLQFVAMKKILTALVLLIAIFIGYQFTDNFYPGNLFDTITLET